jgi:hypothetical protein
MYAGEGQTGFTKRRRSRRALLLFGSRANTELDAIELGRLRILELVDQMATRQPL